MKPNLNHLLAIFVIAAIVKNSSPIPINNCDFTNVKYPNRTFDLTIVRKKETNFIRDLILINFLFLFIARRRMVRFSSDQKYLQR